MNILSDGATIVHILNFTRANTTSIPRTNIIRQVTKVFLMSIEDNIESLFIK